ncbi:MAG: hypothetical protein M3R54_04675 [Chloroflexota bacterium]|nr:hypothetical protein [Chloroflexota bacterium]
MSARIATASLAGYLYLSGAEIGLLSHYWEGLPLGPRDGQAFMAPGLLGVALMALGIALCVGLVLTGPKGPVLLAISVLVAIATAALITFARFIDLSVLLFAPAALFIALLVSSPRPAALLIASGAGLTALAFGASAYLFGPGAWMTNGIDGAALAVWLVLAALSALVALFPPRAPAA